MRELRKKERGVSEVIGTILILGITVVLFSSVFYYVAVMPPPQSQIYSSFVSNYQINSNGTFNITITNYGGESIPVNSTELVVAVQNPTGHATHLLSYPNIYKQIKSDYFRVGSTFTYHSYWDNLKATYLSSIAIYLISTQNNQVVYSNILQGSMPNVNVMGFSYSPDPFPANMTFNARITAFVIYNANYKIIPEVKISIPSYNIINKSMNYISPMQFGFFQSMSPVKAGIYKAYINVTFGSSYYNYTGFIQVVNTQNPIALKITSISLQNPEPVHGSNTTIYISIYNPSNKTEKFRLNITDIFPSYPNEWNYIYTTPSSQNDPTSYFTIGPMTTILISVPWYKIGGSYVAAGAHQLSVSFLNVTPYLASVGSSINVTVYPKIVFVGDGFSSASYNVYNDYYWLFKYLNFPITIIPPTPSSSIFVNVSGYDFVIWVTGSSNGLSIENQNELSKILSEGGSLLLIGNSTYTFSGFYSIIQTSQTKSINKNTTIKYQNFSSKLPNTFLETINYTANVTAPPNIQYVTFSGGNNLTNNILANFSYDSNPAAIYGVYSSNYGKYVFIGYPFSSMLLYQQYYIMNKIILWLSNITILNAVRDIALVDMKISNPNPMFMQPINITFYIQNFSPGPFGPTKLEFELNGQVVPVIQANATIPSNNIYVPSIPGYGNITPITITWYANVVPGIYQIFAYVNPYHNPTEINYNNNILSAMTNVNLNVKFSILVVHAHLSNSKNNISAVLSSLNNTVGVGNYKFLNYIESTGSSPPSPISVNLSSMFKNYNLVIIDVNNSGFFDSDLIYAIKNYVNNPDSYKYPYSLIILGENAGNSIASYPSLMDILNINSIKVSQKNTIGSLYGLTYNGVNINVGPFGQNLSRGYGLRYNYNQYSTTITLSNSNPGTAIFDVNNYGPFNKANYTGNAVIENISNVIVTIFPYNFENIVGLIQNHTLGYSPKSTTSNPLYFSQPYHPKLYARNFLMLNLLVASRYMFNKPLPEIVSPDISINSPIVTLNNYYLWSVTIRNLGAAPTYVTLEAFEETSMFYSSQPIYLVGSTMNSITTVTATVIWKPSYASSPNPEWLRFVLIPSSGSSIPLSPMQEALIPQKVYFFYDNFTNGGTNWIHYNVVFGYSGVQSASYSGSGNAYYPNQPYSVLGSLKDLFSSDINTPSKYLSPQYWSLYPNGISGGYSLGISYNTNGWHIYSGLIKKTGSYILKTNYISVKNAASVFIELYANFQLSLGGEGVVVFVSHDNGNNLHWLPPLQGYPGNINDDFLSGGNYKYPNGGGLVPAFTSLSSGWQYYKFNLADAYGVSPSDISTWENIQLTFVFAYIGGYPGNIYGNDGFYMDDIKVIETGPLTPNSGAINGNSYGDTWHIYNLKYGNSIYTGYVNNLTFQNSNRNINYNYYEIDNLVSIPINLANAISVNMNFLTIYQIWARFANALDPQDVPDGFRLYIGTQTATGIYWHQIDTRWAGEAGYSANANHLSEGQAYLLNASEIASVYYPNMGAFSSFPAPYIDLSGYAGQTIFIKFMANGNTPDGFTSYLYYVNNELPKNMYIFITNVIVQGYSLYAPIQVQSVWT